MTATLDAAKLSKSSVLGQDSGFTWRNSCSSKSTCRVGISLMKTVIPSAPSDKNSSNEVRASFNASFSGSSKFTFITQLLSSLFSQSPDCFHDFLLIYLDNH